MGFCNDLFCCSLLCVHSSFASILMGTREVVALPSLILKNEGVLGSPKEVERNNLALGWGRGLQGTLKYLLVRGMIALTIHLASNKCPYVYNLRHLAICR